MAQNKHTEPCTEIELVKKDIAYLDKAVTKLEKHDENKSTTITNMEKELQEVKNVNTFLLKEVKEFLDVKKKINDIILKYVSKVFFIVFIVGAVTLLIKFKDEILHLLNLL